MQVWILRVHEDGCTWDSDNTIAGRSANAVLDYWLKEIEGLYEGEAWPAEATAAVENLKERTKEHKVGDPECWWQYQCPEQVPWIAELMVQTLVDE